MKRTHAAWVAGTLVLMALACVTFGALSSLLIGWRPFASITTALPVSSVAPPQEGKKGTAVVVMHERIRPKGNGLSAEEFAQLAAQLESYRPLKEKVVVNEAEQQALHALLADAERLEAAAAILKGEALGAHTTKTRAIRMEAVDFLAEAIAWRENPSRSLALELARAAVLNENYHHVASAWLKQDFVGDKLELIEALRTEDPRSLKALAAQALATNSKNKAVLRHAGVL